MYTHGERKKCFVVVVFCLWQWQWLTIKERCLCDGVCVRDLIFNSSFQRFLVHFSCAALFVCILWEITKSIVNKRTQSAHNNPFTVLASSSSPIITNEIYRLFLAIDMIVCQWVFHTECQLPEFVTWIEWNHCSSFVRVCCQLLQTIC